MFHVRDTFSYQQPLVGSSHVWIHDLCNGEKKRGKEQVSLTNRKKFREMESVWKRLAKIIVYNLLKWNI